VGARRKASDQQVNASDERLQAEYASMKLNLAALGTDHGFARILFRPNFFLCKTLDFCYCLHAVGLRQQAGESYAQIGAFPGNPCCRPWHR
jgi:hypothetical protein